MNYIIGLLLAACLLVFGYEQAFAEETIDTLDIIIDQGVVGQPIEQDEPKLVQRQTEEFKGEEPRGSGQDDSTYYEKLFSEHTK